MKKMWGITLAVSLVVGTLSGCSEKSDSIPTTTELTPQAASDASVIPAEDTITALLPPISGQFLDRISEIEQEFNNLYPNLTLKIEPASWEDREQKLDTQVNAGSPPDIAFLDSNDIPKYVDMGVALDLTPYVTEEMLSDYDEAPLNYMKNGDGLYGFPAYMEIHGIGGNKQFLEAAGVDWKSIQTNGWTYDEFSKAAKAGTVVENGKTRYGFIFACSGSVASNYIDIFAKAAGMPARFDENLKYTYTSKNMLAILQGLRTMMDEGSAPKELGSITSGMRWNMFVTGQTMMTGKGLATFEKMAADNNKKLQANDGTAVEDSIEVDYVILPVPSLAGTKPAYYAAVDGYVAFRGKKAPTKEHAENVAKAIYFLSSGKVSAQINSELFSLPITDSARKAAVAFPVERDENNLKAIEYLMENVAPARPDITVDLTAKAKKIEDEVIIPKFQALLADEITAEEMHQEIVKAAINVFGEDGIVKD
ncbi:MAG: ABC transporter substrate-binding protein [Lachnospiraceae bacterium]|jgi:multiple sugar transport system substrate-binding protein